MRSLWIVICSVLLLSCGDGDKITGPDWSLLPSKPDDTQTPDNSGDQNGEDNQEKPAIVEQIIAPTIEVAAADSDIAGLRYEPGISINIATKNFATRLSEIAAAGFKYIEITIKHSYGLKDKSDSQVAAILSEKQQQVDAAGLTVWSIHLPFEDATWTNIAGKESVRVQSVDNIMRVLRLCAANFPTCKNYVLHASKGVLSPRSESVLQARKSLEYMLPEAKRLGVRICIENLVGSLCPTIEEMSDTITGFEDAWVTFDIGHANCVGVNVIDFLKWIGPGLGTVHIHDTAFGSKVDDHRDIGDGDIDKYFGWENVYYTMLKDCRYRGVFLFELSGSNANSVMSSYKMIVEKYKTKYE